MIEIKNVTPPANIWPSQSIEGVIYEYARDHPDTFFFPSVEDFVFTVELRANIIRSAKEMNQNNNKFATFQRSYCNPYYWILTNVGGFQLRPNVRPVAAIRDIYVNSNQYAFECATAMVIIYYHATSLLLHASVFDRFFPDIYLYSWNADPDLGLRGMYLESFVPGDVVYFKNPDYYPKNSPWRGENAVVLEDGRFFGHGIGIKTEREIIEILNKQRKPDSTQSAYLSNLVTRPDFLHLANLSTPNDRIVRKRKSAIIHHNKPSISYIRHMYYGE